MINRQLFIKLRKDHQKYTESRRKIIHLADTALSNSKQAIFSLHRDEVKQAEINLTAAEGLLKNIEKYFVKNPSLDDVGAYKAALEEYVEAKLFCQALKSGKIGPITKIKLSFHDYLAGICDLTGELLRKIVLLATAGKYEQAKRLKELMTNILAELIKFDLTSYLRSKYDEAKRNLKKAEEILYEIKIRGR